MRIHVLALLLGSAVLAVVLAGFVGLVYLSPWLALVPLGLTAGYCFGRAILLTLERRKYLAHRAEMAANEAYTRRMAELVIEPGANRHPLDQAARAILDDVNHAR